jgi:hypothetical protein
MSDAAETRAVAQMDVSPPRLLTTRAVFAESAYGVLLWIPVLISMLVVSVLRYGVATFLLPLATMGAAVFFLPFASGNAYIGRLIRPLRPPARAEEESFIVQLTLTPRMRSGMRALIEDADDVGWLSFTKSTLVFHGDSVRLSLPYEQILQARRQTLGWRGWFVPRVEVAINGLSGVTALEFAERSSYLLPASRKTAQRLYEALNGRVRGAGPPKDKR